MPTLDVPLLETNVLAWPIAPSAGLFLLGVWLVILVAAVIFVSLIFKRAL